MRTHYDWTTLSCVARCEQEYVRAELLESAVIEDVKAMFRDEPFMARIWAEANRRLSAEKPDVEQEIEMLCNP